MTGRRSELLVTGEIYHIYNRSIAVENIFLFKRNCKRAIDLIEFYRFSQNMRFSFYKRMKDDIKNDYSNMYKKSEKLVYIYAYCLMPNHYHLLVKQNKENGIKQFISNFQNSYGKYFNLLNNRTGGVFQSPFKSKRITSDEIFMHVGRYIHLNPISSFIIDPKDIASFLWSSYPNYISGESDDMLEKDKIIKIIGSKEKYRKFIENQSDYQRRLDIIKHVVFD